MTNLQTIGVMSYVCDRYEMFINGGVAAHSNVDDSDDESESQTTQQDVRKRNLVRENIRYKSIVSNADKYWVKTNKRTFPADRMTLAYVTPWNSGGYEAAELFSGKFTHVSPVWHQIALKDKVISLQGTHDVDKKWIARVKANGKTKIVPRFILEGFNPNTLNSAFREANSLIKSIIQFITDYNYDGMVLEGVIPYFDIDRNIRNHFVEKLYKEMKSINKQLILVSPVCLRFRLYKDILSLILTLLCLLFTKPLGTKLVHVEDLIVLGGNCDGISMMTYDYDPNRGQLAPLEMFQYAVQSLEQTGKFTMSKLMLGLPFYGYTGVFGKEASPILGRQYIELLKSHKPKKISWDTSTHEHTFTYKNNQGNEQWVNFPSLLFLEERIQLAKQSGCSLAIWEIGQVEHLLCYFGCDRVGFFANKPITYFRFSLDGESEW
ncbi:glycosyl hydrolase 18 family protein [Heterostelium album PN500]|uniref:Chitinase domain-containing protein 1 n=1 Tax=Heterostelium pallidum (strain ATCC 26659 / Pp 5 / PN500) TaxID=670386 RepID=D3AVQ0_HETP5|nr:glycosyl hydrolase 18 family protein [Heterostelium album PN500]EFA86373.1 glycosyl hydrolase 18 family protein [Heterostelium album PN500]|eukprot:XP_020438478.1 glycosyl hydrolase 18 family protein [Heterostelium album PN500]